MAKDYYKILGVNKGDSDEEIKTAYRNLAKQYHPDVNQSPSAESKFKEISEAYQKITSGKADESSMDDLRSNWSQFFNQSQFDFQQSINPDIHAEIEIEFLDACYGAEKNIHYSYMELCSKINNHDVKKCHNCNGTGRQVMRNGFMTVQTTCMKCMGTGKKIDCSECHGNIYIKKDSEINIKIPIGIDNGKSLRAAGRGNSKGKNGEHGDLFLHINVRPHPIYSRQGNDIYSVLDVDYIDCILGNVIQAGTIHGLANVDIPECSNNNTVVKSKKYGINKDGDHYFKINIVMPKSISQKERKILSNITKLKQK